MASSGKCAACRDNVVKAREGMGSFKVSSRPRAINRKRIHVKSQVDLTWASEPPTETDGQALIHHVVVFTDEAELVLRELWSECLRSYQPMQQILWLYQDIQVPQDIGNVKKCDASALMPLSQARWYMRGATPVHFVKDILSFKALLHFGGLFTDLDVFGLGFSWDQIMPHGILLCQEPNPDGFYQKTYTCVNLAAVGLPKGNQNAQVCVDRMVEKWKKHTVAVLDAQKKAPNWQKKHPDWMFNTRTFSELVQQDPQLRRHVLPTSFCMPLSARAKAFPAAGTALAEKMLVETKLLNMWDRQWPLQLKEKALLWAKQRRMEYLDPSDTQQGLRQKLHEVFPSFVQWLSEPYAHRVLGSALLLSTSDAVKDVLPCELPLLAASVFACVVAWEGLDDEAGIQLQLSQGLGPKRLKRCAAVERPYLAQLYQVGLQPLETMVARIMTAIGQRGAGQRHLLPA